METLMSEIKRKIGRPPKNELSANTKRNAVGRPKGDSAIINEYKARMLSSPKSRKVLDAIFDAALDNEHKNQAAAWKLVVDRIIPVSAFEQEVVKQGGRSAIQINITGLGASVSKPETVDEVTDIEIKDV
jgi:hypothetical protein